MYISPALINKYRKPAAQKSELDEIQHLIDLKQLASKMREALCLNLQRG